MDTQNLSAPSRAQPRIPRGITHINVRQTARYTVIGNHLAQHRELSLLAIGLGTHIQSLPGGARVDIKSLTARFPEGETRIAAALRELEAHGYLSRTRERLPSGQVVTHTVSYNQPRESAVQRARAALAGLRHPGRARVEPLRRLRSDPILDHAQRAPAGPTPCVEPSVEPSVEPPTARADSSVESPTPPGGAAPAPAAPPPASGETPAQARRRPTLPTPRAPGPDGDRTAVDLLAGLHRYDPRLLLAERDVLRLAPAVTAWLERGPTPEAVRRALTADLPEPLRHPAALLAHRLTELLPPPLPAALPPPHRAPLQNCDGCDRAFRAPEPGRCRDCRHRPRIEGAAQQARTDGPPRHLAHSPATPPTRPRTVEAWLNRPPC
ncbi:helix-turn-helix domain-containing protein [Streptomyces sp. NPDC060235]|uniref:helix-turn-helix domain-containing protein n=1 Tax=Streptomyces sp. NPDC060235 TaxID=3347080 RepID=UPI0036547C74